MGPKIFNVESWTGRQLNWRSFAMIHILTCKYEGLYLISDNMESNVQWNKIDTASG